MKTKNKLAEIKAKWFSDEVCNVSERLETDLRWLVARIEYLESENAELRDALREERSWAGEP